MISYEDIEAFTKTNAEAIEAASAFKRRSEKGIPSDRWAVGTEGARLVAQGIHARDQIIAMQTEALIELSESVQKSGKDAMELYSENSKYT